MTPSEPARTKLAFRSPAEVDIAIGQMLALASLAKVGFHVVDGRLVMRSSRMDPKLWAPVRWYLDQIGVDAILDYFQRTSDEDRMVLSAAA